MKFIHVESPKSTLVRPHRFFWHPKDHSCLRTLQLASQCDRPSAEAGCQAETDKGSGPLGRATEDGQAVGPSNGAACPSLISDLQDPDCRRAKGHRAHSTVTPHPALPPLHTCSWLKGWFVLLETIRFWLGFPPFPTWGRQI